MTSNEKIFLVDDEKVVRLSLKRELQSKNYAVEDFESAKDALALISEDWPGVLVSDVMMPKMNGLDLMEKVREIDPEIPVILITGQRNIPMAVPAIHNGAYDFLEKPFSAETFIYAIKRATEKRRLVMEVRKLQSKVNLQNEADKFVIGLPQPVDSSPAGNDVLISIQKVLKNPPTGLNNQLAAIEKSLIAQELTRNRGNIKRTYNNLGLSRQTLYNRLNALGLKRKDFV